MLQKDTTSSNSAFEGGLMPGIDGKVRYMAESVGGLAFSCICMAGKHHRNTKRVQTNSLCEFRGRLMQIIDGKSAVRGVWLRMLAALRFRVCVGLEKNTERGNKFERTHFVDLEVG
jgi:hypothetical protein